MFQTLHRMLHGRQTLKIECGACGHAASWPP
jgi:hypothetical protein